MSCEYVYVEVLVDHKKATRVKAVCLQLATFMSCG